MIKILRYIDRAKVVSFDIFDTFLLRPYVRPDDLFRHLEEIGEAPGFARSRTNAERAAVFESHGRDINIDDIYMRIAPEYKGFKKKEMDLEKQVLSANLEMKVAFDRAKSLGKKIVVASDMYLPKKFIEDVLRKNGFGGYDALYLSNDINARKDTGEMFKRILQDAGVKPSEVLHIGDNKHSDFKIPRKFGIKAVLIPQVVREFLEHDRCAAEFKPKSVGGYAVLALSARRWKFGGGDYFQDLGYRIGGLACLGFARFIEKTALRKNLKSLLFVARDGWTLQKVFNTFNGGIRTRYVYAPRALLKNPEKIPAAYGGYLAECAGGEKRVGVIDGNSAFLSSQKLIEKFIGPVCGIYLELLDNGIYETAQFESFFPRYSTSEYPPEINFLFELLMSSPEFMITGLDDEARPIYQENPDEREQFRSEIYKSISAGIIDFANDVRRIFGGLDIFASGVDCVGLARSFFENPSARDIRMMSGVWIGRDATHTLYEPLYSYRIPLTEVAAHPFKSLKLAEELKWKTPLQTLAVNLFCPLIVKIRGVFKRVEIFIFPKLRRRVFVLELNLTRKIYYRFVIGAKDAK